MGAIDRRQMAERHALDLLAVAGDPVATAIKGAVREATTVEITPDLVGSFSHTWAQEEGPALGISNVEHMLRIAYQAAGFEVIL